MWTDDKARKTAHTFSLASVTVWLVCHWHERRLCSVSQTHTFWMIAALALLLQFNFVGKLLGPRGNSLKRLQEDTLTKMSILGKGSMRDKEKVTLQPPFLFLFFPALILLAPLLPLFYLHIILSRSAALSLSHGLKSRWTGHGFEVEEEKQFYVRFD